MKELENRIIEEDNDICDKYITSIQEKQKNGEAKHHTAIILIVIISIRNIHLRKKHISLCIG